VVAYGSEKEGEADTLNRVRKAEHVRKDARRTTSDVLEISARAVMAGDIP
jgi:hypothetical protein